MKANRPIGTKSYGTISHLPRSRMGPADKSCDQSMAKLATEKTRNKHDKVIVQEKLDGSNVGIIKIKGEILALTRRGYLASTSPFKQHLMFVQWVKANERRFDAMLKEGERLCGEWLVQAHGTRYHLKHEPFVAFDLFAGKQRLIFDELQARCLKHDIVMPHVVHTGGAISIADVLNSLGLHGYHGAIDDVEGAVWRLEKNKEVNPGKNNERKWVFEFIVKYVKPTKIDGLYLPKNPGEQPVWNDYPE